MRHNDDISIRSVFRRALSGCRPKVGWGRPAAAAAGAFLALASSRAGAERFLPLKDPGFETGTGWRIGRGMGRITGAAAHSGRKGLRIVDRDKRAGSSVRSARVAVFGGPMLALRFFARTRSAGGTGVYLDFYDSRGRLLTRPDRRNQVCFSVPDTHGAWKRFTLTARALPAAAFVSVWIHSFDRAVAIRADFDDFTLSVLEGKEIGKVTTSVGPGAEFAIPSRERIAEIAGMLPERPTPVGWPITDRRVWDRLAQDPEAAGILRRAEAEAKAPVPELPDALYLDFSRTGNRRRFEGPYFRRLSRLDTLVLAECLENRGRFMAAIERELAAICSEKTWVLPAHDRNQENFYGRHITIDLGSSARAWLLATVVAWLGDRLPGELRERVVHEIDRRIFQPYLAAARAGRTLGNWWMRGSNNWNAVCTANVIGTALALVRERAVRAEFLAAMEVSIPYFLSGFTADGYCSEGVGYWNYGFGHYLRLGLTVRDATGGRLDIFKIQAEKLRRIARYGLDIQIEPGIAPAFADCSVHAAPSPYVLAMIAAVFPGLVPAVIRAPDRLAGGAIRIGLLAMRPELESRRTPVSNPSGYELPPRTWFGAAQILICRSGPGPDGLRFGAAIKGGNNAEHHNHNDVGSYVVVVGGHPFLVDPGNEVYTRRTFSAHRYDSKVLNSYGHDVPRPAGILQATGRSAAARVLGTRFGGKVDRLDLDLTAAYPVPALKKLVRAFEFDRGRREVRITDRVEFSQPEAFETALVTFDRMQRRSAGELVFYDQRASVVVEVRASGGDLTFREEDIENPGRPTPHRIAAAFTKPVLNAEVCFTIRPARPTADLPGIYVSPEMGRYRPRSSEAIVIEAEDYDAEPGGKVAICRKKGAAGRAVKYWDAQGQSLEWDFTVPSAGWYAVEVRCCRDMPEALATRRVLVDGRPLGGGNGSFAFPWTGGWSSKQNDWREVWLARGGEPALVRLAPGRHRLRMVNDCGVGLDLDRIRLVPVTPPGAGE